MIEINRELVSRLINKQFSEWSILPIEPVVKSGNDNRTFHLGNEMSVRLPSRECYVPQVEKELFWLPKLRPYLSLPISEPIAKGEPAEGYPWVWSINKWLEGETVSYHNISSLNQFAIDLAGFLKELQTINSSNGPIAGKHNFFRGGSLSVYNEETRTAIESLQSILEPEVLTEIWNAALQSEWQKKPVWVHGDIASGNLLVNEGKLCGVIDFGILGIGDPACDLTMAWTFFDEESRKTFMDSMGLDKNTWNRARGWALWKALITFDALEKDSLIAVDAKRIIDTIEKDYQQTK